RSLFEGSSPRSHLKGAVVAFGKLMPTGCKLYDTAVGRTIVRATRFDWHIGSAQKSENPGADHDFIEIMPPYVPLYPRNEVVTHAFYLAWRAAGRRRSRRRVIAATIPTTRRAPARTRMTIAVAPSARNITNDQNKITAIAAIIPPSPRATRMCT